MAYSSDIADMLSAQLTKFTTLNRHQLSGQAANIDFWLDEVRHSLSVIDGYCDRFERLRTAQEAYVSAHATVEFRRELDFRNPELDVEDLKRASKPRQVDDKQLRQSRRNLCDACYRFLVRCYKEKLIAEAKLREMCDTVGIGVDVSDIR